VPDVFWGGQGGVGEDDSDKDYCPSSHDLGDLESNDSDLEMILHNSDQGDTDSTESTGWMLGIS
jgi:hypothetical protein